MHKVFCTAPFLRFMDDLCIPNNLDLQVSEYATGDELLKGVASSEALISNARVKVESGLLVENPELKMIYQPSIGFDNIQKEVFDLVPKVSGLWEEFEFRSQNLTTAEHTLGLMLTASRRLHISMTDVVERGAWDNRAYRIQDLSKMTIGIVGLGFVGSGLARVLGPLGCEILACDPYVLEEKFSSLGVKKVSQEELLSRSNVVSYHTPLNDETRGLFGVNQLDYLRKGCILVNCARGGIVNEDAVILGIEQGLIDTYATDVLIGEDPRGVADHKLVEFASNNSSVIISPHVGGSSYEYMLSIFQLALDRTSAHLG